MLQETLKSDLQKAQLNKDEVKVSTLRLVLSEIRYAEIAQGKTLDDAGVMVVISKELKKRKEAAAGFRQGNREEMAQKEEVEAQILSSYLPSQLSDEELSQVVEEAIKNTGATSVSQMGKVISEVMQKVAGRAEGSRVSALVKEKLDQA